MAKRQSDDVRQWAALGAAQRLTQIHEEQAAIFRAFPELRRSDRAGSAISTSTESAAGGGTIARRGGRRRRRNLSPEARKRISDVQKARWAKFHANASSDGARSASSSRKKR